jgi:hypothetical protein
MSFTDAKCTAKGLFTTINLLYRHRRAVKKSLRRTMAEAMDANDASSSRATHCHLPMDFISNMLTERLQLRSIAKQSPATEDDWVDVTKEIAMEHVI